MTGAAWLDELPPACGALYDFQRKLIDDIGQALVRDDRRILTQAPTGAGKTHVISGVTAAAYWLQMSVLILATRNRIIRQVDQRLDAFDIPHGIIAAPFPQLRDTTARVQVAGIDTLYRRAIVDKRIPLPPADVVIFDEAHLALGASRIAVLDQYPAAIHLGFTATPAKVSGRSLRDRFDRLVLGPSVRALIDRGILVRPRIFSAPAVSQDELDSVAKDSKTGDYAIGEIGALMGRPKLVGDVLANWLRIANGTRTLIFACTKSHGAALTEEFRQAGVAAELLTDQDAEDDREAAIARLECGETTVLVNCFLLSYGVDIPSVETIVLARPTRSVVLYLQAVGRGLRASPGKDHVTIIDHGRVVESLGLPHQDFEWSLDERNVNCAARESTSRKGSSTAEKARICPECAHLWLVSEEGPSCRGCGWAPAPLAKAVAVVAADLVEIDDSCVVADPVALERFFREALAFYAARWPDRWREKEKSARWWAWSHTRERFKLTEERPPSRFWSIPPAALSAPTQGWIKSRLIAWAKRRVA